MLKTAMGSLHNNRKRTLWLAVSFILISALMSILIGIAVDFNCSQLESLLNSSYEYSVITSADFGQDEYYQFNAGISFSEASDSGTGINADIVMQSDNAEYTKEVCWNVRKLEADEIAISSIIARKHGLNVGDILYSKHIVDGTTRAYRIKEIQKKAVNVRTLIHGNTNEGIIIMGYDNGYTENLSHLNILFTRKPISNLASISPTELIYRDDEIQIISKRVIPYVIVVVILTAILGAGLVFILTKDVECNFRRLAVLGLEKKELDSIYQKYIYQVGFVGTLVSLIVSVIIMFLLGISKVAIGIIVVAAIIEAVSMLISALILNKRMWGM